MVVAERAQTVGISHPSPRLRLLIAEDEPAWQQAFKTLLATHPSLDVLPVVPTAEEAETLYEEQQPDVVLLDWHLSGSLDGVSLARRLLEKGHPSSHLILVSGSNTETLDDLPIKKISKLDCARLLAPNLLQLLPLKLTA